MDSLPRSLQPSLALDFLPVSIQEHRPLYGALRRAGSNEAGRGASLARLVHLGSNSVDLTEAHMEAGLCRNGPFRSQGNQQEAQVKKVLGWRHLEAKIKGTKVTLLGVGSHQLEGERDSGGRRPERRMEIREEGREQERRRERKKGGRAGEEREMGNRREGGRAGEEEEEQRGGGSTREEASHNLPSLDSLWLRI